MSQQRYYPPSNRPIIVHTRSGGGCLSIMFGVLAALILFTCISGLILALMTA